MANNDNGVMYILSLVAIVAIVALVLGMNGGSQASSETIFVDEEGNVIGVATEDGNLAGEAKRRPLSKTTTDRAKTIAKR